MFSLYLITPFVLGIVIRVACCCFRKTKIYPMMEKFIDNMCYVLLISIPLLALSLKIYFLQNNTFDSGAEKFISDVLEILLVSEIPIGIFALGHNEN